MAISLTVNGESRIVNVDQDTPLLWVIRDELKLIVCAFINSVRQTTNHSKAHPSSLPLRFLHGRLV